MNAVPSRLVVVGNGMVAATLLEELVARGWKGEITVFGSEPHPAYDRIKLSTLLAGGCEAGELTLLDRGWYDDNGIKLHAGCTVTAIDRERRLVCDSGGQATEYDVCVLATGSTPIVPPIDGAQRDGVHTFRDLADVAGIIESARRAQHATVIGGGLLGLEAAYGLSRRGITVSVVHLMDRLMERQLDDAGADVLRAAIEQMGIRVLLSTSTAAVLGSGRVEAVACDGGRRFASDCVVVACGVRPATALAEQSGLAVNRGIVVDDELRTSDPAIHAIGECSEHRGVVHGVVAPLRLQARSLAARRAGDRSAAFQGSEAATTLKVAGVHVFSAGAVHDEAGDDVLTLADSTSAVYKKVLLRDGHVRGAILVGDLATAPRITALLSAGRAPAAAERLALVAPATGAPAGDVAAGLDDDAVVCGCNGVTKRVIVDAIARSCRSRAEVSRCTRAASSCGSCGVVVDALIAAAGGVAPAPAAPVFCACLPLERGQLRDAIRSRGLRSVENVLAELGDGTGCATCKPALAYLLDVLWCGDYEEDRSARFINDRRHANIQRDGSFSVVPRMFGGVTTPAELRRIADVAERFDVPMVKVTGGQRLDLLGVRKEDLPAIWKALDIPSGHAYAKAVRTVKTCVGSDFCRFGIGDSTALGIALEQTLFGLYTPHKLKSGVTGCPRNCAEVTVKDLGVMAIATGWEIYVGGAAGMSVRKGDLLCAVATAVQALRSCLLFVQHYREQADYLERCYHYVQRAGIDAIRAATVNASGAEQAALLGRLARARSHVRDPWAHEATSPRTPWQFSSLPAIGEESARDAAEGEPEALVAARRSVDARSRGFELVSNLSLAAAAG